MNRFLRKFSLLAGSRNRKAGRDLSRPEMERTRMFLRRVLHHPMQAGLAPGVRKEE
ncbi:MAG TPA: hypothetical protein PK587_00725 [Syntrophales bacterium]|nr:hypothetical protein [Syntrophales bacterium]